MRRTFVFWIVCVTVIGCGEETDSAATDVVIPSLNYSGYELSSFEKGVPLDQEDLAVVAGQPTLVDLINQNFDTITLNLFYVDLGFTAGCLDNQNEAYRLPALANEALERVRARNVSVSDVVVNVELLTPSRLPSSESDVPVLGLCGGDGEGYPTFASPDHRSQLKRDFAALADLPGLKRVTVGVDMNALYHAGEQGEFGFDFSNYVTAYHEIYGVIQRE